MRTVEVIFRGSNIIGCMRKFGVSPNIERSVELLSGLCCPKLVMGCSTCYSKKPHPPPLTQIIKDYDIKLSNRYNQATAGSTQLQTSLIV